MPSIKIGGNVYNDANYIRIPLASDQTKVALYEYKWDADADSKFCLRQGAKTYNAKTLTVYDTNKVKYEFTGASSSAAYCNIFDIEKNVNFGGGASDWKNIASPVPLLKIKEGDEVNVIVTSNTENDINVSGSKISFNMCKTNILAEPSGTNNFFASEDITRDSVNKKIISSKTATDDFSVGGMFIYVFNGCTIPVDVTIEISINGESLF